jgi:very-short-patch-repair endonuclease
MTSLVAARSQLDARIWFGNWAKAADSQIIVSPEVSADAALASYRLRHVGSAYPFLMLVGPLVACLRVSSEITNAHPRLPVIVPGGLAEIVDRLLDPTTEMSLVSGALQGLVPVEHTEQSVLKTIAEGRKANPFLRGPCEGLVYYMLQTRSGTKNRFAPNVRLATSDNPSGYEVDICSIEDKLVIEVDGLEHNATKRRSMDRNKQAHLEKQGFRVLRFTNAQVIEDPVGVWDSISHALSLKTAVSNQG